MLGAEVAARLDEAGYTGSTRYELARILTHGPRSSRDDQLLAQLQDHETQMEIFDSRWAAAEHQRSAVKWIVVLLGLIAAFFGVPLLLDVSADFLQ